MPLRSGHLCESVPPGKPPWRAASHQSDGGIPLPSFRPPTGGAPHPSAAPLFLTHSSKVRSVPAAKLRKGRAGGSQAPELSLASLLPPLRARERSKVLRGESLSGQPRLSSGLLALFLPLATVSASAAAAAGRLLGGARSPGRSWALLAKFSSTGAAARPFVHPSAPQLRGRAVGIAGARSCQAVRRGVRRWHRESGRGEEGQPAVLSSGTFAVIPAVGALLGRLGGDKGSPFGWLSRPTLQREEGNGACPHTPRSGDPGRNFVGYSWSCSLFTSSRGSPPSAPSPSPPPIGLSPLAPPTRLLIEPDRARRPPRSSRKPRSASWAGAPLAPQGCQSSLAGAGGRDGQSSRLLPGVRQQAAGRRRRRRAGGIRWWCCCFCPAVGSGGVVAFVLRDGGDSAGGGADLGLLR